jgi:hypothetical protein
MARGRSSRGPRFTNNHGAAKRKRKPSSLLKDWWTLELTAVALGDVAFAIIVILLAHYANRPLSTTGFGITLNALLSILASISEYSSMFAVPEALCQWRWMRFNNEKSHEGHPLKDLAAFDEASKGSPGAVKLIPFMKMRNLLITLGASMMILHLGHGPFIQQIVPYPQRSVVNPSAKDGRARVELAQNYIGASGAPLRSLSFPKSIVPASDHIHRQPVYCHVRRRLRRSSRTFDWERDIPELSLLDQQLHLGHIRISGRLQHLHRRHRPSQPYMLAR